jgi:hypothetical protein
VKAATGVAEEEEIVVKYALLIYTSEAAREQAPQEAIDRMYEGYARFGQDFGPKIQGGEELQPTSTATTVRLEDDEVVTTDGPFAETKEQLGGFYVVEAADLDEAIAIASRVPSASRGAIEVRPVAPGPSQG